MTTTAASPKAAVPGTASNDAALRSLEPGESEVVLAVFAGMGRRSREQRFLSPKPRLSEVDLELLTAVDQRHHVAVVATAGPDGPPIGIGRFIRDRDLPDSAEVALAVVDAWQGRGVGSLLMRALARRAVEAGVRRFTFFVSPDNLAVLRWLARAPRNVRLVRSDRWTSEYAVSLEGVPR